MISFAKTLIVIALMLYISHGVAPAEELTLTLNEAIALALKENPELRAREKSILSAREDVNIARSFLLPKITFEERFIRTNTPTYVFMSKLNQSRFEMADFMISRLNSPDAVTDFQTSFSFEQALFAPKAYYGLKMAKMELAAKDESVSRNRDEVVFSVFRTFVDAQTAESYINAASKGVEDATEHLRIADSRYRAGLGLYSDMLRAQVALKTAEERKISAEKNLLVAKRALGLICGLTDSVNLQGKGPVIEPKEIGYYVTGSEARSDLKAIMKRRDNAENGMKMAKAAYLPVVGIGGSYQMNSHRSAFEDEGNSYQLIAFLRWDLFDGLRRESEVRKAMYQMQEMNEYLGGMKKKISFEIYESYLAMEEAKKGLELAKANVTAAEEGRRLVKIRYENSLSAIVDMLDVQAGLDAARADAAAKEAAYYTSVARLGYMSGTIMKDLGIER